MITARPDLEAIRRRHAAVPRGPWGFRGQASGSIELRTLHSGGIRLISTMMPAPCFVIVDGGDAQLSDNPCETCRTNFEQQDDDEFDWADAAPCTNPRAHDTLWLWHSDRGLNDWLGHIQPANDWAVKERPYRDDVARVEHPIAEFIERSVDDIGALLGHLERLTSGVLERINAAIDVLAEPSDDRAEEDIAYALAALRSAAQRLGA